MTFRELQDILTQLDDEQLDFDVMSHVDNEYYPVTNLHICIDKEDDRLEDGHPYLEVE
tara:strand:+ start:1820 stop:1993 length:174 start_codon:yes stop_codon:yes gene_type:complete